MEHQPGFSELEFAGKRKVTRREKFLASMDELVPWDNLLAAIKPAYPNPLIQTRLSKPAYPDGKRGRPPIGLERMLRLYFLQQWHGLADATIINAPSSTKDREKKRDPGMHQTKKGNQWYFGMKAHIGADRHSGLVHTVISTAANVSDISQTAGLPHGSETQIHADAGYVGVEKRDEIKAADPVTKIHPGSSFRRSRQRSKSPHRTIERTCAFIQRFPRARRDGA